MSRRLLGALLCFVVVGGCTSSSGHRASGDAATVNGYLSAPDCVTCLEASCSAGLRACDADVGCRQLFDCRSRATTASEDASCLSRFGGDAGPGATMRALSQCSIWSCGKVCPPPPVPDATSAACTARLDTALPGSTAVCAAQRDCACRGCAPEIVACLDDPGCSAFLTCIETKGCRGADCFGVCGPISISEVSVTSTDMRACLDHRCDPCSVTDAGAP